LARERQQKKSGMVVKAAGSSQDVIKPLSYQNKAILPIAGTGGIVFANFTEWCYNQRYLEIHAQKPQNPYPAPQPVDLWIGETVRDLGVSLVVPPPPGV